MTYSKNISLYSEDSSTADYFEDDNDHDDSSEINSDNQPIRPVKA
jgi:hypothetical protein